MRHCAPLKAMVRRFAADARGGLATVFGIALVALMGVAGSAVDLANLHAQKEKLQGIADRSALAAARELRLANSSTTTVLQVAQNYVLAGTGGATVVFAGSVASDKTSLTVSLTQTVPTYLMHYIGANYVDVGASSSAKIVGGAPICVIGLDSGASYTVGLQQSAALNAANCAVYSNSTNPAGLFAKNSATLTAAFICSAGGKSGAGPGSFVPTPQTDCPVLPDPLASRAAPVASTCLFTNLAVLGGRRTLLPGTYCGGISIGLLANVTLSSGTYVIKDGPLLVTGGATLTGASAGIYLTGTGAVLNFDTLSNISLTAQTTGDMAGMLVFEDRAAPAGRIHEILSNNARTLLGTIYLPKGTLHVGANSAVADKSAFTIVVANHFSLSAGPTMVLNSNYGGTSVPVPDGLGPNGSKTVLVK